MERTRPPITSAFEADSLISYTLHLADNALILGHRNSEWTGHGPILEQDIAISNIALDLVGQARNFYQYAAGLINSYNNHLLFKQGHPNRVVTEDDLAYLRDVREFKNCLLTEQENGDWAHTILRQFFFSAYQFQLFNKLQQGKDRVLAAISEKAIKEVTYHLRWSSEWVIRLGDGTTESHNRLLIAVDLLWKFTRELFIPSEYELSAMNSQIAIDPVLLESAWRQNIHDVFEEAGILGSLPPASEEMWIGLSGKEGTHSEHLGYILAEMQFLQRAYPGCDW
jgi:ring-1,2-phenylacetyl-CoA epoxidase subunit PaaC